MRFAPYCRLVGALAACWSLCGAQLPLRRYTTADGLANNAVLNIASDSRGFLWFATAEGLSRFDGVGFANQTEATGLPHRMVRQVLIGRNGNYWLATPRGLVRFRPEIGQANVDRMVVLRPNGKPEAAQIFALLEDHNGTLWCGTGAGLYAIYDTASQTPSLIEVPIGLPGVAWGDSDVSALAEDAEGGVWIGTTDGSLYRRLPDGRVERYPSADKSPQSVVMHLFSDRKGRIWVGRGDALYRSNPAPHPGANGFELLSGQKGGPPLGRVFDILETREGDVWAAIYRCVAQFPVDGTRVRIWDKENGLPSRGVGSLSQDRDGNLWMGTGDQGAFKLAAGGILTYSTSDGIGMDGVVSVAETLRGELFVAGRLESEGFRVATRSGDGFHSIAPRVPKRVHYFGWRAARVLLQDNAGEWWLATSQGLCRYPRLESPSQLAQTMPKAIYTKADGLPGDVVVRLYEDRHGNIWIGSETAVFVYWSRSEQRFVKIAAEGTPGFASAFGEDNFGNVWIGDEQGQLWRARDGRASLVRGLARTTFRGFLLDHAGRLWVATVGQGLLRFDQPAAADPHYQRYGYADGLSSVEVYSVAEDRNGFIYLGTGGGVDRLDPNVTRIRHYTPADGIAQGQVVSAYRDRTGALWFGTFHGLTRLVPDDNSARDPPQVWITGLSIGGRRAAVSEAGESSIRRVEVPPNQEHIQFDYVGLSYAPGNVLRYQYRLGDEAWSAPIESRTIHYGALAPGQYRFAVRALNSDGEVSPVPATVEFSVIPGLWRRAWFQGILVALAIGGTFWVQGMRAARLLAIERVRTRIATDLHDDIGTSLSQIAILSEVAYQRAGPGKSGEPIERIGTLSRELLDSISDIVWTIQPHKDHLSDLKQRMRRFAADLLSAQNIGMQWSVSAPGRDFELNTELRQQVYLIFKESVKNIAQHSQATEARIDLRIVDRQLILDVTDNGRGMENGDHPEGNGLKSMKLRAARLGGNLQVRSAPGEGTTVLLRTPLPV
jgi:ligand-binding sensor domain-containing protein/signal transduction histidine kinase